MGTSATTDSEVSQPAYVTASATGVTLGAASLRRLRRVGGKGGEGGGGGGWARRGSGQVGGG